MEVISSPFLVSRKLDNQIRFLKKLMHARPGTEERFVAPVWTIENARAEICSTATDLDTARNRLMGFEGIAGRSYFQCLSALLPEKYQFKGRFRRPAKDPFNACLNYCYGILYSLVEKGCILSGLDLYVGFLHTDNYNKKSLVFDLIEPFRIYGEQTAIYLFTGKKWKRKKMTDIKTLFRSSFFWDAGDIDAAEHAAYVIGRVLDYGDIEDVRVLRDIYPDEKIIEAIRTRRGLLPQTGKYWAVKFNIPFSEVSCLRKYYPGQL